MLDLFLAADVQQAIGLHGGDIGGDRRCGLGQGDAEFGKAGVDAHAMAPFLGQGANQALQDAYVIAQGITNINNGDDNLSNMVQSYEKLRKLPTASLSLKSNFLGFIETLGGPIGSLVRDNFFRFVGKLGVAGFIFLDGAKPRINTN